MCPFPLSPQKKYVFSCILGKLVLPNQGGVMTKPKTSKERERMYRQKYGVSESEARGAKTEADLKRIADRKSEKRSSGR